MSKLVLIVLSAFLACGCVASNMTQLTEALAKDPATACISIGTPYGTLSVARTNPMNGQSNEISATGGGCSVKNYASSAK